MYSRYGWIAAAFVVLTVAPLAHGQGTLQWTNGTAGSWQHNWLGATNRIAGISGNAGLTNPKNGFDADVARFQTTVTAANVPMTVFTGSLSLGAIQTLPTTGVTTGGAVVVTATETTGTLRLNGATANGSGLTADVILAATNNDVATGYDLTINSGTGVTLQLGTGLGGVTTAFADSGRTITINVTVGEAVVNRGFSKTGTGRLVLTGANTFTGTNTVFAGLLSVNNTSGSGTGSGAVNVNAGGTLGGSGTIAGAVTSTGGTLNAGAAAGQVGTLSVANNVTLDAASTFRADITAAGFDQLRVAGGTARSINLNGATLDVSGASRTNGDISTLWLLNNETTGALTGTFNGLGNASVVTQLDGVGGASNWRIYYEADFVTNSLTGGNDVALTPIPEPATVLPLGMAALGVLGVIRRRRRSAATRSGTAALPVNQSDVPNNSATTIRATARVMGRARPPWPDRER